MGTIRTLVLSGGGGRGAFPAARIIDYDEYTDQLIEFGRQAAARAFMQSFPG